MVQSPLQSALVAAAKDLPIGAEFNQDEIRLKGAEEAQSALEAALVTMDTAHQGERQCCCSGEGDPASLSSMTSSTRFVLLLLEKSTGWSSRK